MAKIMKAIYGILFTHGGCFMLCKWHSLEGYLPHEINRETVLFHGKNLFGGVPFSTKSSAVTGLCLGLYTITQKFGAIFSDEGYLAEIEV